jgi:transposase
VVDLEVLTISRFHFSEAPVDHVGIDLHKKTIVACAMGQDRKVIRRRTLACCEPEAVRDFFAGLAPFRAVVEATASYEWLVALIEPLAEGVVLAHPQKLRVIAESVKKTDRLDARVLAEFLARDMVPEAHRPTPRQRQHRAPVRHRQHLKQAATALRNRMRRVLADYNADREGLFAAGARDEAVAAAGLSGGDRPPDQPHAPWRRLEEQVIEAGRRLKEFASGAPPREAEARAKPATIPGVGPVTVDVVVSEPGDVGRFKSVEAVCAYAGLAPKVREGAGKRKQLRITKEGSPLLRWAPVEAAGRVVRRSAAWRRIYEGIRRRAGGKRAIVAVARRRPGGAAGGRASG